jgi:type VI protein secretion system component VasA
LRHEADAFAVSRPSISTFLQGSVVQFSAHVQRCLQFFPLLAVRVQTIFERQS